MKESSDRGLEETPSAEETPEVDPPVAKTRTRRAFSFLRAPSFWGGLVVGLVALGVGVAIGLGIDRWVGDDRVSDADERGHFAVRTFRTDPSGEWDREGPRWPGGKRFWFRFLEGEPGNWQDKEPGGKKKFEGDPYSQKDDPREGGFYLSDAELALLERFIDVIEEVVDEVGDYLQKGGFDPSGDRSFGPAWFFEDDRWKDFEGRIFGEGSRKDDKGSETYPEGYGEDHEGSWDEEDGPLGGSGFSFGEFFPGFAFLEDCELDFQELPGILESLPDEEDDLEDSESLNQFFEQIDELFREACEQPSDS